MIDYIDGLVREHFPCVFPTSEHPYCGKGGRHLEACPAYYRDDATDFARAVAARVKASAMVCACDEEPLGPDPDCPRSAGRGVTFGGDA